MTRFQIPIDPQKSRLLTIKFVVRRQQTPRISTQNWTTRSYCVMSDGDSQFAGDRMMSDGDRK